MTVLEQTLERLGLQQYHDLLVAEGFETWETVLDITESDLEKLDVKLGHRRKLQRAIASYRGVTQDRSLESAKQDNLNQDNQWTEGILRETSQAKSQTLTTREQKRRYRRHPKPDEDAPEKPASAYVLFSNKIRDDVKAMNLSFTDIARMVGEKWQRLEPSEKIVYETRATETKEQYNQLLAEYKKTDMYQKYASYLADFKARHSGQAETTNGITDNKRPKLLDERSTSADEPYPEDNSDILQFDQPHQRMGSISSRSTISRTGQSPSGLQVTAAVQGIDVNLIQRSSESASILPRLHMTDSLARSGYTQSIDRVGSSPAIGQIQRAERESLYQQLSNDSSLNMRPSMRYENSPEGIPRNTTFVKQSRSGQYAIAPLPHSMISRPTTDASFFPRPPVDHPVSEPYQEAQLDAAHRFYTASPPQRSPSQYSSGGSVPISQLLEPSPSTDFAQRKLPPLRQLTDPCAQSATSPSKTDQSVSSGSATNRHKNKPPESIAFRPGS